MLAELQQGRLGKSGLGACSGDPAASAGETRSPGDHPEGWMLPARCCTEWPGTWWLRGTCPSSPRRARRTCLFTGNGGWEGALFWSSPDGQVSLGISQPVLKLWRSPLYRWGNCGPSPRFLQHTRKQAVGPWREVSPCLATRPGGRPRAAAGPVRRHLGRGRA